MLRASPLVRAVDGAASAAEALVALGDGGAAYDGLFLDVRMPGLDGLELARVLRRFERPPAIVFVSAFDDAAVDAFELAALDYLVKPVSRQRLDEAIERVRRATGAAPAGADGLDADVLPVDTLRGGGTRLLARSLDPLPAGARRLRARRVRRGALPAARAHGRAGGALVASTASRACTAATSSTCAARSRSGRSSTAPRCS